MTRKNDPVIEYLDPITFTSEQLDELGKAMSTDNYIWRFERMTLEEFRRIYPDRQLGKE